MGAALTCLDENSALDFLSGRLGSTALSEAERHLGTCAPCIELLARSAPLFPSRAVGEGADRVTPPNTPSSLATLAMPARHNRFSMTQESSPAPSVDVSATDESGLGEGKPTLPPGTTLKGTYEVLDLIGRGGMGEVYEVRHARLAGRYALKLLPPIFAHEHVSVTRFRREADILSALRHPNIVQVIDFDHTPAGQPFLVMEYLDGGDLSQLMATVGAMPLPRVLKIVEQIVSALSAVHRRGIVHRDLKPQNVLLVHDEDFVTDRVKLVDFGLSKRSEALRDLSGNISRDQTLLGTPRYMAPEQAAGRIDEIDATTDQFALAAMIYEMLTGTSAFDGEHMAMLLYRIVSENPAPMRRYVPDMPEHVEAAVRRAMEKQRSDRFPSVAEFLDALLDRPSMLAGERSADSARGAITPPPLRTPAASPAPVMAASLPLTPPRRRSRGAVIGTVAGMAAAAALAVGWHMSRTPAPALPPAVVHEAAPPPAPEAPPAPPAAAAAEPALAVTTAPIPEPAPRAKAHLKAAGRPARTPRRSAPALGPSPSAEPASPSPAPAPEAPPRKVGRLVEEL